MSPEEFAPYYQRAIANQLPQAQQEQDENISQLYHTLTGMGLLRT